MFRRIFGTTISTMCTNIEPRTVQKLVQVLPVIKPSQSCPTGKILLCNWKDGDYQGRYTGVIQEYLEASNAINISLEALQDFAQQIVPTELSEYVSKSEIKLHGVLGFDGPPENLEYVFIANVSNQLISPANITFADRYPYVFAWFDLNKIPYQEMPADDEVWYKYVLDGKKITGSFVFGGVQERTIKSYELKAVDELIV